MIACWRLDFTAALLRLIPGSPASGPRGGGHRRTSRRHEGCRHRWRRAGATSAPRRLRRSLTRTPASSIASATSFATGRSQLDAPQAAAAPEILDGQFGRRRVVRGRADRARQQVADRVGAGQQAFGLDHVEHGERPGTDDRDRRRTSRRAHRAEREIGARHERTDRQPAAKRLGQGHHVRHDARARDREPVAAAAHPRLHLVDDQESAPVVAQRARTRAGRRPTAAARRPRPSPVRAARRRHRASSRLRARPDRRAARTGTSPPAARTARASPAVRSPPTRPPCARGTTPRAPRSSGRPVASPCLRASLIAASFASAPELAKNTWASGIGSSAASRAASRACGSVA